MPLNQISLTARAAGAHCAGTLSGAAAAGGLFKRCTVAGQKAVGANAALAELLQAGKWEDFLRAAVRARKNFIVSGATSSGKTTLAKALNTRLADSAEEVALEPPWHSRRLQTGRMDRHYHPREQDSEAD